MACSKEERVLTEEGLCGICSEPYNDPRCLPTCGHTFCENCLFTFVFDLKEKGQLDTTFDCPVCQTSRPLQDTGEVTLEWIQTFPMVTAMAERDKGSCEADLEDTDKTKSCGMCSDVDVVIPGRKYCLDCQAHLCDDCAETHKKFKPLRSHKVLDGGEFLECESLLSEFHEYRKCSKHPDRDVELYCKDDDAFLCLLCASTSHKICRNVVEAAENTTASKDAIEELRKRIDKAQNHLDTIQQLSSTNNDTFETQMDTFVKDVSDSIDKIFSTLGSFIEKAQGRANQLKQDEKGRELKTSGNVTRLKALFDKKLLQLDYLSKYCSAPELYIGSEQLGNEIETLEKEVYILDSTLEIADPSLAALDELRKLSEQLDPSKLLNVPVILKSSDHHPKYTLPLQVPSPFAVGTVEKHMVSFSSACSPTFSGISMKDDTGLILCDSCSLKDCGNLCFYNPEGKKKNTLKRKDSYSATLLDKGIVALVQLSNKIISVLTLDWEIGETTVTTKYEPRCIIALRDGKVAISWSDPPGFSIADISGPTLQESQYLTQDSDGRTFRSFEYMAIDEPRKLVIQPCHEDKAVYGFDFTGKPVFKYTNNLKRPKGVTVDSKGGIVYVCDGSDACIHQLSVKGQPIAVIRHTELKEPLGICYSTKGNCLWVTHYTSPYDVLFCFKRA